MIIRLNGVKVKETMFGKKYHIALRNNSHMKVIHGMN